VKGGQPLRFDVFDTVTVDAMSVADAECEAPPRHLDTGDRVEGVGDDPNLGIHEAVIELADLDGETVESERLALPGQIVEISHRLQSGRGGTRHNPAMTFTQHNPPGVFPPYSNYAHGVEVPSGSRLLFISGLNGYEADGSTMPEDFESQTRLIWGYLETILASAGMTFANLVSVRFYLADPAHDPANVEMLKRYLGQHKSARTVVCAGMLDPGWLIEVEAIAAA
jgi:2-iminobutanoate/2-iminopropanoate deaminase